MFIVMWNENSVLRNARRKRDNNVRFKYKTNNNDIYMFFFKLVLCVRRIAYDMVDTGTLVYDN